MKRFAPFFVKRTFNHPTVHLYNFIFLTPIIHPPVCQKGSLGAHHPAGAKLKKGHLLKCLFRVIFVRTKKLVVRKGQKPKKEHLLKCRFGVVPKIQKAQNRTLVEVSFWGCA